MAETGASVVKDILQELVVQGAEQALEADETTTVIRYMNRYMFMLDAQGIALGYTEVNNLGDPITVPAGAIMGMIKNIAMMIAPQFDVTASAELVAAANQGLDAMRKLGSSIQPAQFPCTLPIGSGNEGDTFDNEFHFFPCPDNDILTEAGRNILLEDQTNGGS